MFLSPLRKLKHREVKLLAQGQIATKRPWGTQVQIRARPRPFLSSPLCPLPLLMNRTQTSDSNRSTRWELGGIGAVWMRVQAGGAWRREVASTLQGGDALGVYLLPLHRTGERGGRARDEPTRWASTGPALCPPRAEVSPLPQESWAPAFSEDSLSFRKSGPTPSELATKGGLSSWERNTFPPCHFIEFGRAFYF